MKMKNGVAYPIAPEVKAMIEKKRREMQKKIGCRISQAKFTGMIGPALEKSISEYQFKPRVTKSTKNKLQRSRNVRIKKFNS